MLFFIFMITVFLAGIVLIAMEDKTHVNKSAVALLMSVVLWTAAATFRVDLSGPNSFLEQLGDVSQTLFFVMGALVIIELIDSHGGFRVVSNLITTTNKRKLMIIISLLTFFGSALLDNVATAVVMIALLRKFVPRQKTRWVYASMVIIAANAGGSFSPVGDVTTILLWTGGNIEAVHQIGVLILPALVCMLVPMMLCNLMFFKKGDRVVRQGAARMLVENARLSAVSDHSRWVMLILGVATMLSVPLFQSSGSLPPFMRVMMGMAVLWIYTDIMYGKLDLPEEDKLRVSAVLSRIDMSTIMFFLGVLMSVSALKVSGLLTTVGAFFEDTLSNPLLVSFTIGVMSSFTDNVALVAATQGMYPLAETGAYAVNSEFWTFLAYCAVTGGSMLIIGSATGVTVMGMEKISFMYYLKRFSLLAASGYIAGAAVYLLIA